MTNLPKPSASFTSKKTRILEQLAVPDSDYSDASLKGSVDVGIRQLIKQINEASGFVTTSSCAGRVSVFLEGRKKLPSSDGETADLQVAGSGGKGGGGAWLFVSHDPLSATSEGSSCQQPWLHQFGFMGDVQETDCASTEKRLIHFKFEPMILHVSTASVEHAQVILRCGLQAGFRESGAVQITPSNTEAATPMVAIRSMGMSFESLIGVEVGGKRECLVSASYLDTLVQVANDRFVENEKRIARFSEAFHDAAVGEAAPRLNAEGLQWEDAAARRERMKREGLERRSETRREGRASGETSQELPLDLHTMMPPSSASS